MGSWDDYKLVCMHGEREGLDSHDCAECQAIAKKLGWEPQRGGYIITTKYYKKHKLRDVLEEPD